jgi:2'-5' RNA ligase
MIRAFFAIKIPLTPQLRRTYARFSELGDRFRPVAVDGLHVTLKFLGDTAEDQLPAICSAAKGIVERLPPLVLSLKGLGAFPHERRPAVVWVGFATAEPLCRIAGDLDRGLAALGYPPEGKAFQPHLTVLRVNSRPPEELFAVLAENTQTDFGTIRIERVELFQSELGRRGPRYTSLASFSFGPGEQI